MKIEKSSSLTVGNRRNILFKLACICLFAGSAVGFARSVVPTHERQTVANLLASNIPSYRRLVQSSMTSRLGDSSITNEIGLNERFPRLTADEEKVLLRQAVEYRRLNQLEKDAAMQSPTNSLPLVSVRAKAAGYGDDFDLYEDAKYQGQKAREMLVTRNMGLVHYCVNNIVGKDYSNNKGNSKKGSLPFRNFYGNVPLNSLSREDLIQEGAIGLARAVDKWDLSIGGKFSTYAVYWVRAAILRCIAERDDMLRVPGHISSAVHKINKAAKKLGVELARSYSWEEASDAKKLAEEAGLSQRNFEEAMKVRSRRYSGGYVPFESWMQKGRHLGNDTPVDSIMAPDEDSEAAEAIANEELRSVLCEFLGHKEMEALSWRYGLLKDEKESPEERANRQFAEMELELFGNAPLAASSFVVDAKTNAAALPPTIRGETMTFTEVGKRMQVSAEYTRKLCHRALKKLKQAVEDGRLEPALLY